MIKIMRKKNEYRLFKKIRILLVLRKNGILIMSNKNIFKCSQKILVSLLSPIIVILLIVSCCELARNGFVKKLLVFRVELFTSTVWSNELFFQIDPDVIFAIPLGLSLD